jgi:hypothetical protein
MHAGIHWIHSASELKRMALMDVDFSSILLEHKPFFDGLFETLRFTRKEIETARTGMDLKSLELPFVGLVIARQLKRWEINKMINRLGIGHIVAKKLSFRLRKASALCLITAHQRDPIGYMEAGRAMQQLWLAATAEGLSIHPYGVIPQYLTMVDIEPETFLPRHATHIKSHREPFFAIFPEAKNEYPAVMLRIGWVNKQSARNPIRLRAEQIIRR